jgi:serine/threonine protein kinase
VAGALAEAHDIGLIHRDIKPANIVLCRQGGACDVPKVLDFGLVKQLDSHGDAHRTAANAIVGTPHYLSPESIKTPDAIDARSDLYALGAVGYFLLTGQQVFEGETVVEVCLKHLDAAPVSPSERLGAPIAPRVEQLVLDCLAKDAADRPQTAHELLDRLRAAETPAWSEKRAREWWDTHGSALEARRSVSPEASDRGRTLAVDHARRS